MIIDCHVHLFESLRVYSKEDWDRRCRRRRELMGDEAFMKWQASFNGRVETLVKDMDEAGVDKSVVFASGPFKGEPNPEISVWECNEYIAEAQRKYPDRIIGFVRLDLTKPIKYTLKLLETGITEWGLQGVKIIPDRPLTDDSCREVMDKVNELEVPVLLHMGAAPTPPPFLIEHGRPEILDALTLRYPKMRIVAAHCGGGYEDLLAELIYNRVGTIFADLALQQDHYAKSPWHFIMQMRYFMDKMPDQIVMASDWPMAVRGLCGGLTHKDWFDVIRNLKIPEQVLKLGLGIKDFSQEEKDKILGENARRFLGI